MPRKLSSQKRRPAIVGSNNHKRPRTAKTAGFRIPPPQAVRIMQRYIAGENVRAIPRDEGRDRGTISRIVKSEEMQTHVAGMRQQYYGLADLAMNNLRRALEQNSDGRLAHEILRNLGVVPTAEQIAMLQPKQSDPTTEEELVKAEMVKLVAVAYERAKIYGQPKPALDNVRAPKQNEAADIR